MATWYLDQSFHLDQEETAVIEGEFELTVDVAMRLDPLKDREMVITSEYDVDVVHSISLDLLPLIPEKFHSSPILQAYIKECGFQIGGVLTKTKDIVLLLSPNTTGSAQYLRLLGALIGVKFPPEDDATVAELRKILSEAIDWYKLKGTYKSVNILSQIEGFTTNLYDMYTNDYISFLLTDWFVGGEDENPPGLDSSYYKSPHFGVEVVLNKVYDIGSQRFLWSENYLTNLAEQVEETRPVHTVPHFLILLNPKTDERGNLIEVDGEIKAKIASNWEAGIKYFDGLGSLNMWNFDDSTMIFDASLTTFIKSITKWVLGTGNYPCTLASSDPTIENPVLIGSIALSDINIYDDRYEFEFIVPKATVQSDISELGLYIPGSPDRLVAISCFPKINKTSDIELRVILQVYKEDLSV
jgi:hypothetical protein